ncbi:MAG: DUF4149 domain-containing protein [Candidatus Sericytochromatia bacterium]
MIKEISSTESSNMYSIKESKISTFFDVITFITLSIVIFGIFSLGFFVAPIIFSHLTPRPVASETMTLIFMKYYPFAFTCSFISLFSESISLFLSRKATNYKLSLVRFICIVAVFIMTSYTTNIIVPEINDMRINQKGPTLWTNPTFVSLHQQSEKLGKASFGVGLIPLIIMIIRKKK